MTGLVEGFRKMSIKGIPRRIIIHSMGAPLSQTPQNIQGRKWLLQAEEECADRSWGAGIDGVALGHGRGCIRGRRPEEMDRNDWCVCGGAGQGAGKSRRGSRVESTLSGKWEGWRRSVLCIVEGGIGLPVSVSSLPLTASCRV